MTHRARLSGRAHPPRAPEFRLPAPWSLPAPVSGPEHLRDTYEALVRLVKQRRKERKRQVLETLDPLEWAGGGRAMTS